MSKNVWARPSAVNDVPIDWKKIDAERNFKAEYFHNLWIARKKKSGKHYTDYHNNPMVVPPPLRDDGKTRCNDCCLKMAPYSQLSEKDREAVYEIVEHLPKVEAAWRARA